MLELYEGNMTSKERVLRTFAHEKTDRVPIGFFANPGILRRTAAALGVAADKDSVGRALGVDFRGLMPAYTGKPLFPEPGPGRRGYGAFVSGGTLRRPACVPRLHLHGKARRDDARRGPAERGRNA